MYDFDQVEGAVEAGLRVWVTFILIFWIAGMRAELCIFLGAIAGVATWQLVRYWKVEKVDLPPKAEKQTSEAPLIGSLGQVLRRPAERFWTGAGSKFPKLSSRKPRRRL